MMIAPDKDYFLIVVQTRGEPDKDAAVAGQNKAYANAGNERSGQDFGL